MRELSIVWKINSQAIYDPDSDTHVEIRNLIADGSGITDDGKMHITYKRKGIRTVHIRYDVMTQEEISFILNLIQDEEFSLTYEDPILGIHTIDCYAPESSQDFFTRVLYGGVWRNVTFKCMEK